MNTDMENMIKKLSRELLITRIFTGILSILMILILVGGVLAYRGFTRYTEEINAEMERAMAMLEEYAGDIRPAIAKLEEVDIQAVNDTLATLNQTMASVDWEKVTTQLSALDIDSLNEAIEGLDTQELSVTLRNMNDVVEKLQNISDGMKSFFSKFTNR